MKTIGKITTIEELEKGAGCFDFTRHEDHGTYVPDRNTEVTVWSDEEGNSFIDVADHWAMYSSNYPVPSVELPEITDEHRWCAGYTESID